jgi:hypothetical protein
MVSETFGTVSVSLSLLRLRNQNAMRLESPGAEHLDALGRHLDDEFIRQHASCDNGVFVNRKDVHGCGLSSSSIAVRVAVNRLTPQA